MQSLFQFLSCGVLVRIVSSLLALALFTPHYVAGQLSQTAQWPKARFDIHNTGQCPYNLGVVTEPFILYKYATYYNGHIYGSPVVTDNGDVIFGATDHAVYCITSNADVKWVFDGEDMITTSPLLTKESVIVGSYSSKLYALNITSGEKQWSFTTGGPITSSASVTPSGQIFFSSGDQYTYCLDRNGTLRWKYFINSSTASAPALSDDATSVYISGGAQLFSLSALSGELLWSWKSPATGGLSLVNPATTSDGSVMFAAGSNVYQLSNLGSLKWTYQVVGDVMDAISVASQDGSIIFGTASYRGKTTGNGYLYKIARGGSLIWRQEASATKSFIKGVASGVTITADSSLIFGGFDDKVHCVSSMGSPLWNFTMYGYGKASPVVTRSGQVIVTGYEEDYTRNVFFLSMGPTAAPTLAPSPIPTTKPKPLILPYRFEIADSSVLWIGATISFIIALAVYFLRGIQLVVIPNFVLRVIPSSLTRKMQSRRSTMTENLKIMPKIMKMGFFDVVLSLTLSLCATVSNFLQIYRYWDAAAQRDYAIIMIAARVVMALYSIVLLIQTFAKPSLRDLIAVEYFFSPSVWLLIVLVSLFDASHLRLLPWKQTEFVARSGGFPCNMMFKWTLLSSSLNSLVQLSLSAAKGLELASTVSFSLSLCSFLLTSVTAALKLTASNGLQSASASGRDNRTVSQLVSEIGNLKQQLCDKSQETSAGEVSLELPQITTNPIVVDTIPDFIEGPNRRLNYQNRQDETVAHVELSL